MKRNLHKKAIPPLQVEDFMCRHCLVQPTRNDDHICGFCKAFGKTAEPKTVSRQANRLAAKLPKMLRLWCQDHNFFGLSKIEATVLKLE